MDKPEDKKPPQSPLRPPVPPPLGKKPGAPLPKGPVPPRAPGALPPRPGMPGLPGLPGAPVNRPPMAPVSGRPPLPPMPGAQRPPMPGTPALPPQIESKMAEAEGATGELENKISELEKRLMEEREKVLLANLRSKEEEAVSAKVETSIKDIQDKLRREKREQEMDEGRRRAETRLAEMERRIAEEREAWVSTLKNQLGQRDQVSQEMESHFSARLKDLEYRWAQEKSALESALRDREADAVRIRQESSLKSEQEKGFWEDRVRTVAADRDKFERELERLRDRIDQEKVQLVAERQMLRDQLLKAENGLKFAEEHARSEKMAVTRESEATINLIRSQMASEKDGLERQLSGLNAQLQSQAREIADKTTTLAGIEQQLIAVRAQSAQIEARVQERERALDDARSQIAHLKKFEELHRDSTDRMRVAEGRVQALENQVEEWRRRAADIEQDASVKRFQFDHQLEELRRELGRTHAMAQEESARAIARVEAEFGEKKVRYETEIAGLNETLGRIRTAAAEEVSRIQKGFEAESAEKRTKYDSEIASLNDQLSRVKAAAHEESARANIRVESEFAEKRRKFEEEIASLRSDLAREKVSAQTEVARERAAAQEHFGKEIAEVESRMRALQARLDWYDANAKREYDSARQKVQVELETLEARALDSERTIDELRSAEAQRMQILEDARQANVRADELRAAAQVELEEARGEVRRLQLESEARFRELESRLEEEKQQVLIAQEARKAIEHEIRQQNEQILAAQKSVAQREGQIEDLKVRLVDLHQNIETEREHKKSVEEQLERARAMLKTFGENSVDDLKSEISRKSDEIAELRERLVQVTDKEREADKRQAVSEEKEQVLRELITEKERSLDELKGKVGVMVNEVGEAREQVNALKDELRRRESGEGQFAADFEREMKQRETAHREEIARLESRLSAETEKLSQAHRYELESLAQSQAEKGKAELQAILDAHTAELERVRAEAAMAAQSNATLVQAPPPDTAAIEAEIRQQLETEFLEKLTQIESQGTGQIDAAKKEAEKMKWEADAAREELRRSREARIKVEREANDLLRQAEAHFKKEIEKVKGEGAPQAASPVSGGIFTRIGRFLDSPVVEFGGKKKKEEEPPK